MAYTPFEVTLNGRPYRVNAEAYQRRFLEVVREQADTSDEPSEASLNPVGLWRRSQTDFFYGDGQEWFDHPDSRRDRFDTGSGITTCENGIMASVKLVDITSNLFDTLISSLMTDDSNTLDYYTIQQILNSNDKLYAWLTAWGIDGVRYDGLAVAGGDPGSEAAKWCIVDGGTDAVVWKSQSPNEHTFINMVDSDSTVWVAFTTASSTTNAPTGSYTDLVTGQPGLFQATENPLNSDNSLTDTFIKIFGSAVPDRIGFEHGRLLVADDWDLYNVTSTSGTLGSSLVPAAVNPYHQWSAFEGHQAHVFAASNGFVDGTSTIYKIGFNETSGELAVPVPAAQMPSYEYINEMYSYTSIIMLGSNIGLRVGISNSGNIQYGPVIETDYPVYDFSAKFNEMLSGGRTNQVLFVDLTRFIDTDTQDLVPAVHSRHVVPEFSVAVDAEVHQICKRNQKWVILAKEAGAGSNDAARAKVYIESTTGEIEPYSWFETSKITYGLSSDKTFHYLTMKGRISPGESSINVSYITSDNSTWTQLALISGVDGYFDGKLDLEGVTGSWIKFRFEFFSDGTHQPCLDEWVLQAMPTTDRTEQIELHLDLSENIALANGGTVRQQDVWAEFNMIRDLVKSSARVPYTEFGRTYDVTVENVQFGPSLKVGEQDFEGDCAVLLRIFDDESDFLANNFTQADFIDGLIVPTVNEQTTAGLLVPFSIEATEVENLPGIGG